MMSHARELMDSENPILSNIGYALWHMDGQATPEQLDTMCKALLELAELPTPDESFRVGYDLGKDEGYVKGFEDASK